METKPPKIERSHISSLKKILDSTDDPSSSSPNSDTDFRSTIIPAKIKNTPVKDTSFTSLNR